MTSIIYSVSTEKLKEIVKNSKTYTEILRFFELQNIGNNHKTLKRRLDNEGIDYTHIVKNSGGVKGSAPCLGLTLEDALSKVFIIGEKLISASVKKYLKRYKLIPYQCCFCLNMGCWLGKPLTLEVDHINGNNLDNRLENLRYICPNCHSQTPTFRGRKLRKHKISNIDPDYKKRPRPHLRKTARPNKQELEKLVNSKPFTSIAKQYGVSDNCIRKWCRYEKVKIPKFPPGYWLKNGECGRARTDV